MEEASPYALIQAPTKEQNFCEESSRCTWTKDKKAVPYCSVHRSSEVCRGSDPNYKLVACFPDRYTCLAELDKKKSYSSSSSCSLL